MKDFSLDDVDFDELLSRLTLHAQSLSTAMGCIGLEEGVLPGGESAEDLAMTTLMKFLDPQDGSVTWSEIKGQPTTQGVLAYLRKVLARDFLDIKKSKRYKTTVYEDICGDEDCEAGITFEQLAAAIETPEGQALKRQRMEWIAKQFDSEADLKEIAKLQFDPTGYSAFSNQELAQLLDTSVKDIENRKKRIKSRLKKLAASQIVKEAEHV